MHQRKFTSDLIRNMLLCVLAISFSGCANQYYRIITRNPDRVALQDLDKAGKSFVVHTGDSSFVMKSIKFRGDTVTGKYSGKYSQHKNKNDIPPIDSVSKHPVKSYQHGLGNEVHLYVPVAKNVPVPGYFESSFALTDIWRMDIISLNPPLTVAQKSVRFIGITAGGLLLTSLIVLTTSCPFIYVDAGDSYSFAGEVYSGAIYAPLERHDYLALPELIEKNGAYNLRMTNEAKEIEYTNLAELYVVDHAGNTKVLFDKYGNYQSYSDQKSPAAAASFDGTDVRSFIASKDDICYPGEIKDNVIPLTDGIIMSFDAPEGVSSGKLFIRARNSHWLDYVYKCSHDLFGGYYDNWVRKQATRKPEDMIKWSLDQKIPLIVFVEKNGQWEFCDYFNNIGPASFRDDVLAIDLKDIKDSIVRIKLESGAFFWELDYVAMDFTINAPVSITRVPVSKAITATEKDVAGMLRYDDLNYFTQAGHSDDACLEFRVPPKKEGERSVFLHSKGYYQILSEASGLPKARKLKELREPMKFPEFSRSLLMRRYLKENELISK